MCSWGAVAAAIPSLGITQAAYLGGIAVGAAGASAYSAIAQIWDHYCCECEDKDTQDDGDGKKDERAF